MPLKTGSGADPKAPIASKNAPREVPVLFSQHAADPPWINAPRKRVPISIRSGSLLEGFRSGRAASMKPPSIAIGPSLDHH